VSLAIHSKKSAEDTKTFHPISLSYIAPSGVQKERIVPTDIFVLPYPLVEPPSPHADRVFLRRPQKNLKESACTPLFWNAFDLRDAGSCVHTHSQNAVMATLLWHGEVFEISHQEVCALLSSTWSISRIFWDKIKRIRALDDQRCADWWHGESIIISRQAHGPDH
jgi:Class II Aldolase and Adducin N-terminal domain